CCPFSYFGVGIRPFYRYRCTLCRWILYGNQFCSTVPDDEESLAKLATLGICRHLLYPFVFPQGLDLDGCPLFSICHYRVERVPRLEENLSKFSVILPFYGNFDRFSSNLGTRSTR